MNGVRANLAKRLPPDWQAPWGGVLEGTSEIIPDEPDTDNAGVGRKDNMQE